MVSVYESQIDGECSRQQWQRAIGRLREISEMCPQHSVFLEKPFDEVVGGQIRIDAIVPL